ncbi:MAG TPA: 50S ribosomal protein L32 [Candidatus Babeliales bacterium]|nr:50S ribosomal protein L32 [Candidatus Babeliales bacterium]
MPVPKRKLSKSRRDKRSANKGIMMHGFGTCSNCTKPVLPHSACLECGFYKGEKVLETKMDRAMARGKKVEERQESLAAKQEAVQ